MVEAGGKLEVGEVMEGAKLETLWRGLSWPLFGGPGCCLSPTGMYR